MSDMEQADLEWLTTDQSKELPTEKWVTGAAQYREFELNADTRAHAGCGGDARFFSEGRLFKHYICERCKTQLSFRR